MEVKNELLKKSLGILGISLGESSSKLDSASVIAHLDKVQKSMADALLEANANIERFSKKFTGVEGAEAYAEVLKKSFSGITNSLDEKFGALGIVMKSMVEENEANSTAVTEISNSIEVMSEVMVDMKSLIEGIASQDMRMKSMMAGKYVEKSFDGREDDDDNAEMAGIKRVNIADRNAILSLFDQAEEVVKKSSNGVGIDSIIELASKYEASGIFDSEMHEVLSKNLKVKFVQ